MVKKYKRLIGSRGTLPDENYRKIIYDFDHILFRFLKKYVMVVKTIAEYDLLDYEKDIVYLIIEANNIVRIYLNGALLFGSVDDDGEEVIPIPPIGEGDSGGFGFDTDWADTPMDIVQGGEELNYEYVVQGSMKSYNGYDPPYLAFSVINSYGLRNSNYGWFNNGYDGAVAVDGDKVLVAGGMTNYNNTVARNHIYRLNRDGSVDGTFNIGTGFNDIPACLIVEEDRYIVGGWFSSYNGVPANSIVALKKDGSIDDTFNTGTGFDHDVYYMIKDSDKYVIGGSFEDYNGDAYTGIIRINQDGSVDNTFSVGTGVTAGAWAGDVYTLTKMADGGYLIGGNFSSYNGNLVSDIAKLNYNGSYDSGFATTLNNDVLKVLADGNKALIGGYFSQCNGNPCPGLVRLNSDGSTDNTFVPRFTSGSDIYATDFIKDVWGKYVIIGSGNNFKEYDNRPAYYIVRVESDGSVDNSFNKYTP